MEEYNKQALKYQKLMERSLRLNNKENYNNDGTIKKGSKFKKTKNYKKYNRLYKTILRKAHCSSLETKNKIANELISHTSSITYEEMNFKSLQKRVNNKYDENNKLIIERSDKISTINGKQVHKCKKKKRFGKVLKNKSPAKFLEILKNKCKFYDIPMNAIHTQTYKASQYNHVEDNYKKKGLNERWMYITLNKPNKTNKDETITYKVQRDLYSSFLIKYPNKDYTLPNREQCLKEFETFLILHNKCIEKVKATNPNRLSCFGF